MDTEGKFGWEEIMDSRLDPKCDFHELNEVAALAYKCINLTPRKRPSMRDIVQVLTESLNQSIIRIVIRIIVIITGLCHP
ncbi:putative non-specific serine/threonine protein kinase [Lupinus albus]|uniref:Putative non-specific serine/threonine protein kinase n=1 Tax=Lupinus albus TaxID=3870 RepID=A0A6A4NGM6_LUPAL|nr:putative non-specific serine/threonine protein kinase [Lupinus albus]